MPVSDFNVIGGAYSDEVLPLAAQECINFYPEVVEAEGGRNVIALKGTPGLEAWCEGLNGPVRGMHVMGDILYTVNGERLYKINSAGTETELGTIPGTNRVGMGDNGTQLAITNGQGYVWDGSTLAQITDPDFNGSYTFGYMDGYGLYDGLGDSFQISANGDFDDLNALDFATPEYSPDPLVAVFVDHMEVWLFGSQTTEVWQNTGNPDFPFERNQGTVIERGLGARFTPAKMDNTVYWLAEDGMVYAASGYIPQRISTHAIEKDIQETGFSDAFSFTYRDKGHWFYVLTLPGGKTWAYDASSKLWHRRKSFGLNRWRVNGYAKCYGKHLVGDYSLGTIWDMRSDLYAEGGQPLVAERISQYGHSNQQPMFHRSHELVFEGGIGLVTGQGSAPIVEMRYSDDGARTFCNWKQRSLGAIGVYGNRVRYQGLGRFLSRCLHIRISDPVKRNLIASTARYDTGSYT